MRIYNGQLSAAELSSVYAEFDSYYNNTLPTANDDTYTLPEDASILQVFVPANLGVLVNDTDAEGDGLTAVLVTEPQHGTLVLSANGSFSYDSDPDFFGTDSFTYTANDFRPSAPATVTLEVTPQYDPAVANADQYKLLSGTVLHVDAGSGLLNNDLNPDQVALQVEVATPVTAGSLTLNPDGSFDYDPQGFAGRARFDYHIKDGTGISQPATVTLIVNTPPEAVDDAFQVNEDTLLITTPATGLLANDVDAERDALTATLISDASHGTVTLATDGTFNYAPEANYFGSDEFTYQVADGEDNSNVATVRLTVNSVNDAPTAAADTYFTLANTSLTIPPTAGVLQNDQDIESQPLVARLVQDVSQGRLTMNTNGSFSYVPPADFTGVATFSYRADDGQDQSDPTTVQIAINSLEQQQQIVINELHVDPDIKTELVEFVELHNRGDVPIDLSGWRLRNAVDFVFPAGSSVAPGEYLVVSENPEMFANKFGRSALGPWDGKLSNDRETLELWNATGTQIDDVDYQLGFPWPTTGDAPGPSLQLVNPALANDVGGNWLGAVPTPGEVNSVLAQNAPPTMRQVNHSPQQPHSNEPVTITVVVSDSDNVGNVSLAYQLVNPGDYITKSDDRYEALWTNVAMHDDGQNGDAEAADGIYTVVLPADVQQHRRLVRYRVTATDTLGASRMAPYADDPQPNFAYFVYDQIPAWTGAAQPGTTPEVTYSSELLQSVPVYQLITTHTNHVDSQYISDSEARSGYTGSDYRWEGTMVYDGVVYDHIHFRARGGVWRYAMGKNMWKFDFDRGHSFQASDEYGNPYDVPWDKLNFSAIIQQGDYLHRGEQGLFESVGFELFDMAGTESPESHYVHFRLITGADENGQDQYSGDFQGLYLVLEQPDSNYLDQHDLPDGNFYKMESNAPESTVNQSATQVDDASDVRAFVREFTGNRKPTVEWWQDNLNLEKYYGYQAISQAIHHYDTAFGKNFYYFNNPDTGKWEIHPWDLDLTWADNMYGNENHEFNVKVARNPDFNNYVNQANIDLKNRLNAEYQNVVREVMDLLYNPEQTGMLIDQTAAIVYQPGEVSLVDADRAMWDYNPINAEASRYTNTSKNATRYHFYDRVPSKDFAGMIQLMKDYVESRSRWMEQRLLTNEENIPTTPFINYTGPVDFPINNLTFAASAFASPIGAEFSGMKWRIAEVTDPNAPDFNPYDQSGPRSYEINATWESDVMTTFDPAVTIPGHVLQPGKTYRVRVRVQDNDNHWSHWSEPIQFVATTAVGNEVAAALRISEINYNPYDTTPTERAAGFVDNNDFEFVELVNISAQKIDLTGATLDRVQLNGEEQGVEFAFADGSVTQLAPGQRVVVVENLEAFQQRYGTNLPVAGQWSGRLSNGGETITLASLGSIVQQFAYSDGWYDSTDGDGATLEVIQPSNPDLNSWNQPTAWQASATRGGSPGRGAVTEIPGDANRDGVFNSSDLVAVFQIGEYEDNIAGNSTWDEGDWDGDGEFTTADIVAAFQFGAMLPTHAQRYSLSPKSSTQSLTTGTSFQCAVQMSMRPCWKKCSVSALGSGRSVSTQKVAQKRHCVLDSQ